MSHAFPSKRRRAIYQRVYEEKRNPTAGRTSAESKAIMRMCKRFANNLEHIRKLTRYQAMPWLPVRDVITDKDDDAIQDWRGVAEHMKDDGYQVDDDGLLVQMQDPGLRASNRIEVVTTYLDMIDGLNHQDYMIRKTVFSPFPCSAWGRLPLTLTQWRVIALALIDSRAMWQWEEAVNVYARRNGIELFDRFNYQSCVGWNLVNSAKLSDDQDQEGRIWTGNIIYTLAAGMSLTANMKNGSHA